MTEVLRVLSLGAGVQSSTLALMSARGDLPKLDCAIFADTGWEPAAVYQWLDWLETQLPFPVHRVRRPGPDLGVMSMAVASGETPRRGSSLPPWYVRMDQERTVLKVDEDGFENEYVIPEKGMLPKQCSKEFKTRAVGRKLREMIGLEPGQRGPKEVAVEQWMGISQDEMQRMKSAEQPWVRNVFPLIEKRMRRYDCLRWIESRQYPRPPKSSCIFCPYRGNIQWRDMRDNAPEDWARAIAFDESIRPGFADMHGSAYVHRQHVPLALADLSPANGDQPDLFDEECDGVCGV